MRLRVCYIFHYFSIDFQERFFTISTPTSPIHSSKMPDRSPLGKRSFEKVYQKRDPVIKYVSKSYVAGSKVTKPNSSVPNTESASSVKA